LNKKKIRAEKHVVIVQSKIPKPPPNFSAEARALWKKVCGELIARRTLTTTAVFTVEQFVSLTLASREAMRDKKVSYAQKWSLVREARLLGESLGLSPSAQVKVKPPVGALTDSADDKRWAEIVGEG
jgi:phage terminase small subunit